MPRPSVLRVPLLAGCLVAFGSAVACAGLPQEISVDPARGDDRNPGSAERPVRTISAALALLPDPLGESVTVHLAPGRYDTTGGHAMSTGRLELMHRMRPGVGVRIVGRSPESPAVFGWESDTALVDVRDGDWWFENVQIGTFTTRQRRGVSVAGPGQVTLKNVTFRTRSLSDAGIHAHRGGLVSLRGRIALNEHLHAEAPDESFCGIIAETHGVVRFEDHENATLEIGNGSLSASYYGVIRLGCATARITSWGEQSNNLAINNSGRIDLHDTALTLGAKRRRNTPIGLEHDGHILGEGARIVIVSSNEMAIALQKASTFTCNAIELRGTYETCVFASSGSMFVGRFKCDVGAIDATTGSTVNIEHIDGKLIGPVAARHAARISLPDRDVLPE